MGEKSIWGSSRFLQNLDCKCLKAAIVVPVEHNSGAWAGRPYKRMLTLFNDNFFDLTGRIEWALLDLPWTPIGPLIPGNEKATISMPLEEIGREHVLKSGTMDFSLPAVTHQDVELAFDMPKADSAKSWTLHMEMKDKDGKTLYQDDLPIGAVPPVDWSSVKEAVLWPEAGTFKELKSCPFKYRVSADLPKDKSSIVIVPRGSNPSFKQWADLESFMNEGGAVLLLTDDCGPGFIGSTPVKSSNSRTAIAHKRIPEHPALKDVPGESLRYWVGAAGTFWSPPFEKDMSKFTICENSWLKPEGGNAWPILDAGISKYRSIEPELGLAQSPLFEVRNGKGRALVSNLLFAEGLRTDEPGAAILLRNSLQYLQDKSKWLGGELKPVYCIGTDLSHYRAATTKDMKDAGTVFVDAWDKAGSNAISNPQELAKLLDFAKSGGNLLLHNISEDQAKVISSAIGMKLECGKPPVGVIHEYCWRLDWTGDSPLKRGLCLWDVNWCHTASALQRVIAIQEILRLSVKAEGVDNLTPQGALLSVPLGKGKLVIDQVLWDAPAGTRKSIGRATWDNKDAGKDMKFRVFPADGYLKARAEGYICRLLNNLDVKFEPYSKRHFDGRPQPEKDTVAQWGFDVAMPEIVMRKDAKSPDSLEKGAKINPWDYNE